MKVKTTIIAAILLMAMVGMIMSVSDNSEAAAPEPESIMVADDPFRVDDDAALAIEADSGSGTIADPWIIENREVDAAGSGFGIFIGNVTEHFVIRNCTINGTDVAASHPWNVSTGIHLYNVWGGNVTNCTVWDCLTYGMFLSNETEHINVTDSDIWDCTLRGIAVDDTDNCVISGNTISGNETMIFGMSFDDLSDGHLIHNNTIQDILVIGLGFNDSWTFQMYDNTITGFLNDTGPDDIAGPLYGVILYNSNYTIMSRNKISDCYIALNVSGTAHMGNYSNNYFNESITYGVQLGNCSAERFFNNTFSGNEVNAYDPDGNGWWNTSTHGNWWDDYTGTDSDNDGIGETVYTFTTNTDYYPLTSTPTTTTGSTIGTVPYVPPAEVIPTTTTDEEGMDISLGWAFWAGAILLVLGFAAIPIPYIQPLWLKVGGVFLILLNFLM